MVTAKFEVSYLESHVNFILLEDEKLLSAFKTKSHFRRFVVCVFLPGPSTVIGMTPCLMIT